MKTKRLAIIGASYLQEPIIRTAKKLGIETHVFAWKCGDIGEQLADFFYPISIVEKENILEKCKEIEIDGICSIASDLAVITVNYVAHAMGLIGNSLESTMVTTNKYEMRRCFERNGDPSPRSIKVHSVHDLSEIELSYPVVVKPIDRSGSRGITKLENSEGLELAIENAKEQGFEKAALVEEFAEGQEYSVEYLSWKGQHHFLALTKKYTTGAPHFIETAHLEPAPIGQETLTQIRKIVEHALDSLQVKYGASHSEIKIDNHGKIKIIEIGARMGGDFIGSHLVKLSTGVDFVEAVIRVALGEEPYVCPGKRMSAAVRFAFSREDIAAFKEMEKDDYVQVIKKDILSNEVHPVTDSSTRMGYYIFQSEDFEAINRFLPEKKEAGELRRR